MCLASGAGGYTPALSRSVAQPGRALCSGRRGRRFESSHSDQEDPCAYGGAGFDELAHPGGAGCLDEPGIGYVAREALPFQPHTQLRPGAVEANEAFRGGESPATVTWPGSAGARWNVAGVCASCSPAAPRARSCWGEVHRGLAGGGGLRGPADRKMLQLIAPAGHDHPFEARGERLVDQLRPHRDDEAVGTAGSRFVRVTSCRRLTLIGRDASVRRTNQMKSRSMMETQPLAEF